MDAKIEQALKQDRVVDITTTGRKSGKSRRIEIWFHYQGDGIGYLSGSPGTRDWAANLRAHPQFTVHVKRGAKADLAAEAEAITDVGERRRVLTSIYGEDEPNLEERIAGSPLMRVRLGEELS